MNKQQRILAAILLLVVSLARAQTVEYIHTDALGSPVAVTNASGAVIERTVYEPYGAVINRPVTNGPGYTGHVMDAVTGLNYMQQRYYDPQLGRFLSIDPVTATSAGANFNRYWYANDNPYKYSDPDGRESACVVASGCGSFAAAPSPEAMGLVADFLPVIGDAKGVLDAWQDPTPANLVAAVIGLAGPAGDVAGKIVKGADDVADAGRTFHRLESPTQTSETAAAQQESGEIWGRVPRGSDVPTVQAYAGPLPAGARGIEFVTDTLPSGFNFLSGEARCREGAPGVESRTVNEQDFAVIKCTVTGNTQC